MLLVVFVVLRVQQSLSQGFDQPCELGLVVGLADQPTVQPLYLVERGHEVLHGPVPETAFDTDRWVLQKIPHQQVVFDIYLKHALRTIVGEDQVVYSAQLESRTAGVDLVDQLQCRHWAERLNYDYKA